jgi:hypothetical protein
MTFKSFCYNQWLEYMEECMCYGTHGTPYKLWFNQYKWHLRKVYRLRYNKLQSEWKPDYEHLLSK